MLREAEAMALQRLLRRSQTAWLVCLTVTGLLMLVACVPQTSGYGSADGYGYHTVRSGETLFEIAWKYGKITTISRAGTSSVTDHLFTPGKSCA